MLDHRLSFAGWRQRVIAGAPVGRGHAPLGSDESSGFQATERWIERAVFDLEKLIGSLLDVLGDLVTICGTLSKRLHNHHAQSALQDLKLFLLARPSLKSVSYDR
jgi:hypothetical protein